MGFRIATNIPALQGQQSLQKVRKEGQESNVKLSSGERINKAADDAAGLAISEKMKAEIRSSRQANRNANDGISLVQTAEGGLNESSSLLTRMRELAIQSATDTLTDSDREKSSLEYNQLKLELERISQSTEFNGKKLLNGTVGRMDFQVGVGSNTADDQVSFEPKSLNAGIESLGVTSANINSKSSAQQSLASLDRAINKISSHRSMLGSIQQRLTTGSNNLTTYTMNMSEANSRIRDTDYAAESATSARASILESAGTAVLAQANVTGQLASKLLG